MDSLLSGNVKVAVSESPSESTSEDELSIVFESVPVRGDAQSSQSSKGKSRKRKRDPTDFSTCCFCNKTMSCIVEYITHTAGCNKKRKDSEEKSSDSSAESKASDSDEASVVAVSPVETSEEILNATTTCPDVSVPSPPISETSRPSPPASETSWPWLSPAVSSGPSPSPTEASRPWFFPAVVSGPSPVPTEVSGPSSYPAEVSGPWLSPAVVPGPSYYPDGVSEPKYFSSGVQYPATGNGCSFERDPVVYSGAGYITQSNPVSWDFPTPPPEVEGPCKTSRLTFHSGCVTDSLYKNPSTAIVVMADCVAVRPAKGLMSEVISKYPYSDVYSSRRQIGTLNRAWREDRPNPGTYKISRPSAANTGDPAVVAIFGQFYMGSGFETNQFSQKIVETIKAKAGYWLDPYTETVDPQRCDLNLFTGLQWDMQENRVHWFRQALEELAGVLRKEGITRVVIPYGLGCGPAGGDWLKDYLVAIEAFEVQVSSQGVEVVIVTKVEDKKPVAFCQRDNFTQSKHRPHQGQRPYARGSTS
ncbi:mucin-17-like [Palaemon carinicauda]|uniref:mucin-17-like n=1 Tax=Palaemon carinicauda TaxID=392227 RepID=UPI0035B68B90